MVPAKEDCENAVIAPADMLHLNDTGGEEELPESLEGNDVSQ